MNHQAFKKNKKNTWWTPDNNDSQSITNSKHIQTDLDSCIVLKIVVLSRIMRTTLLTVITHSNTIRDPDMDASTPTNPSSESVPQWVVSNWA